MKKIAIIILVAILALAGILYFNKTKKSDQNTDKLTVGVHSWPGGGMVYIGEKMGFFKEEGINLIIKKIENFDTKRASLASSQIDVDVANTLDQLLIYNESGFPAKIIGITDESNGGDGLVSHSAVTKVEDLRGKTIAYAEASPSDFFLRYILKKNNIASSEVTLKPVADPQVAGNAVISGAVDASVTYEPFLSQAAKTKGLHVLVSTKMFPTLIPGLLIVDGKKLSADRDLYERFLKAWFKSADYYYSNRAASQEIIAKGMGMSVTDVKDILSAVDIQTKDMNRKLVSTTTDNNVFELLSSINVFWKENGFIKKSLQTNQMLDTLSITK